MRVRRVVDQPLGVDLLQPIDGEGWPGAVAQQALQSLPIMAELGFFNC